MNFLLRFSTATLLLALAACSPPKPETLIPKIQQEAQVFVDALVSGNEEVVATKLPAGYLKLIDGQVGEYMNVRGNSFRQASFVIKSSTIGIPQVPQMIESTFVSFVPVRTLLKYDDGGNFGEIRIFGPTSVTMLSHLVAVSLNKGKTWKFFEPEDRAIIDTVLPSTVGKLVIPAKLVDATPN